MKSVTTKNSQPAAATAKPFFNKGSKDSFFSKGSESESSFFSTSNIQANLAVGAPDDPYEQEAEKVSRQVMEGFDTNSSIQRKIAFMGIQPMLIQPMSFGTRISRRLQKNQQAVQTKCTECEKEDKLAQPKSLGIQFSGDGAMVPNGIESMIQSKRGGGSGMDPQTLSIMESSFGADFSGVRMHTDSQAVQMSQQLNAHAFTVGNDIFFNQGRYQPSSKEGAGLLAHELTHTVQQGASLQNKRINRQSLRNSLSNHTMAHLSAMSGIESTGLNRKEIAQLGQLPEDEMKKVQQLQILQLKGVDKVQKKDSSLNLRRCSKPSPETRCCDYDTFEKSNDTYVDTPTDTRKNIKFTVKMKPGADKSKCVMVNWIQGTAKNKDGTFRKVKMFGNTVDYNFPSMRIDSLDNDPVYWSDTSGRWKYTTVGSDSFYATDSPGPTTWVDGIDYDLKFKMCLYCIDNVSTTSDAAGSGVTNPLKCIDWVFKAKYDATSSTFTH